jgi:diguanylate cyclase (GGDEF)-like protein/hemerythrin-like metal-binding protein/PAS domain S-box-containing protein
VCALEQDLPMSVDLSHLPFFLVILLLSLLTLATVLRSRIEARRERAAAEERGRGLRERLDFLTDLVENNGAAIYAKDVEGRYRMVNRKWEEVTGTPRDKVIGRTALSVFKPGEDAVSGVREQEVVASGTLVEEEEVVHTPDGDRHFLSIKFPLHGKDNAVSGLCGVATEITQAKRDLQRFQDLAMRLETERNYAQANALTDGLTGLANRRHFDEVLTTELFRLRRTGGNLALVMLDVDQFKRYNDYYGHPAGDECLRRLAQALRGSFQRASDFGARYGGEEFAVVMPDTDLAGAATMAERIRRMVEDLAIPHVDNPPGGRVTVSLGVAARNALRLDTWDRLLDLADAALYRAKEFGRNRVECASVDGPSGGDTANLIRLVWRQSAESGHPLIDGQHRALFDQSNRLLSAIVEGRPADVCAEHLRRLLGEVQGHFRDEEAVLLEKGYPEAAQHAGIHAELESRAEAMRAAFEQGEAGLGELFSFLAYEVVAQHMFREDRKFFPYLAARPG